MKTRLASYSNGQIDLAFPLLDKRMTIGRDANNSIQLPHEKISKNHAVLLQTTYGWVLEDLQSKNGVFVNGQRVDRPVMLKNGDTVNIGDYELHFETDVPSDDWVPSYIINLSAKTNEKTIGPDA